MLRPIQILRYVAGSWPSEPHFVARPGATEEDDGVIVTPVMDGADAKLASFLAVLDARDLSLVAKLPLGAALPGTVHGYFNFTGSS